MSVCRSSPTYEKGLDKFIERIFSKKGKDGHIYCPCIHCGNHKWVDWVQAKTHLHCDGFFEGYKNSTVFFKPDDTPLWDADDDMQGLAQSVFHMFEDEDEDDDIGQTENQTVPKLNAEKFYKVLEDAKKELYPGCKFSVLSFIVRLFHSKCVGKCNEKGFSMILDTNRETFPHASVPNSLYELRKVIRDLGLGYENIDACPNDCESTTQADNDGDYEDSFDGTEEHEGLPRCLKGEQVLAELKDFEIKFLKLVKDNPSLPYNWKKRSIFFELPYWKNNLIRHNIDVMHTEKNVCDGLIGTLMNID
ncbi:uncharacterized protein [Rutidosis leptorrhynchoides]|uniref:uncharacterized protein n=1 Tax=Rutidosis leptorrhynchoides TaxID=125765 RepID=UPI003A98E02D